MDVDERTCSIVVTLGFVVGCVVEEVMVMWIDHSV